MQTMAIVFISGLGSERYGPGSLFREWGARLRAQLGKYCALFYYPYSAKEIAQRVAEAAFGFERVVVIGHSDGGSMLKAIADQFARRGGPMIDLAILLDPAPDFARGQIYFWQLAQWFEWARWKLPPSVIRRAVCFYQTGENFWGIVGVCGCPIRTIPQVHTNTDVTPWRVKHSALPGDPRIQEIVNGLVWDIAQEEVLETGGNAV